jgi:hypothetical protein
MGFVSVKVMPRFDSAEERSVHFAPSTEKIQCYLPPSHH